MPKIPDATSVALDTSVRQQGVIALRGGDARGKGLQALGEAVGRTGQMIDAANKADADYELSRAKAKLSIASAKINNETYEGLDYSKIPESHDQMFDSGVEEISKGMKNPRARRLFQEDVAYRRETSRTTMFAVARAKEKDVERGNVDAMLAELREASVTGDMLDAIESAELLVDSAVEKGYFGAEEGVATLASWRQAAVTERLKTMRPEDRIEALKQPWAKNLPEGDRKALLRESEDAALATEAQVAAEFYIDSDMSREDAIADVNNIVDHRLRKETRDRVNTRYDRQERNNNESSSKSFEELASLLDEDGATYDSLASNHAEQLASLPVAYRENLKKLSDGKVSPRKYSDLNVLSRMETAMIDGERSGNWDAYNEIIKSDLYKLTPEDQRKYVIQAANSKMGEEAKSGLTDVELVNGLTAKSGMPKATADRLKQVILYDLDVWRREAIKATGRAPDQDAVDAFVRKKLSKRDTWGTDKYDADLTNEERLEATIKENNIGDSEHKLVISTLAAVGFPTPTPEQIIAGIDQGLHTVDPIRVNEILDANGITNPTPKQYAKAIEASQKAIEASQSED